MFPAPDAASPNPFEPFASLDPPGSNFSGPLNVSVSFVAFFGKPLTVGPRQCLYVLNQIRITPSGPYYTAEPSFKHVSIHIVWLKNKRLLMVIKDCRLTVSTGQDNFKEFFPVWVVAGLVLLTIRGFFFSPPLLFHRWGWSSAFNLFANFQPPRIPSGSEGRPAQALGAHQPELRF